MRPFHPLTRRQMLRGLALAPVAAAVACADDDLASSRADSSGADSSGSDAGGADSSPVDSKIACEPQGKGAAITHGPISGGATSSGLRAAVRLNGPAQVSFAATPVGGGSAVSASCALATQANDFAAVCDFTGLAAATRYDIVPVVDGVPQPSRAIRSRTFAASSTSVDFSFAFGSCCRYSDDGAATNSKGKVFEVASAWPDAPWFFAQIGDWTYPDYAFAKNGLDDKANNYTVYPEELAKSWRRRLTDNYPLRKLLAEVPLAHVWDDHDFAENNAHRDVTGQQSDRVAAFSRYLPCYPLAASAGGVWQKFTLGHCEFFLVDMRSQRSNIKAAIKTEIQPDGTKKAWLEEPPSHTMLGPEQLAWLIDGLKSSKALWKFVFLPVEINPRYDALMSEALKLGIGLLIEAIGDMWCGYLTERKQLLDLHTTGAVKNIVFLTGDAHMGAMLQREAQCPPVFMAANLDITQAPIIDLAEQFGFPRGDFWPEWTQDGTGENTIGRVRVVTQPKPQVICESWGASGQLLHSMTIDAQS